MTCREVDAEGSGTGRNAEEEEYYTQQRRKWDPSQSKGTGRALPPAPPADDEFEGGRGGGAFI